MRLLSIKYRLLILLTLILGAGFMATSLASYLASRQAIEHGIADQTLPLTGDNITRKSRRTCCALSSFPR